MQKILLKQGIHTASILLGRGSFAFCNPAAFPQKILPCSWFLMVTNGSPGFFFSQVYSIIFMTAQGVGELLKSWLTCLSKRFVLR